MMALTNPGCSNRKLSVHLKVGCYEHPLSCIMTSSSSHLPVNNTLIDPSHTLEYEFSKWLKGHGVDVSSLALGLGHFPKTGRGMVALRSIGVGEEILSIPESLIMSRDSGIQNSPMKVILEETEYGQDNFTGLTLLLMYESQNESSYWKPFLALLPLQFDTPIFWSEEDLEIVRPTPLFEEMVTMKGVLRESYEKFVKPWKGKYDVLDGMDFSFERFLWAISTVWNRAYWIDKDDTKPGIVPLADMLNHSAESGSLPSLSYGKADYRLDPITHCFNIISCDSYLPGEEVFTTYGHKDNENLVSDYGFLLDLPPSEDRFTLDLSVVQARLFPESVVQKIAELADWLQITIFFKPTPKLKVTAASPWELLAFARILSLSTPKLVEYNQTTSALLRVLEPVLEPDEEIQSLKLAKLICMAQPLAVTLIEPTNPTPTAHAALAYSFIRWYRQCLDTTLLKLSAYLDSME